MYRFENSKVQQDLIKTASDSSEFLVEGSWPFGRLTKADVNILM